MILKYFCKIYGNMAKILPQAKIDFFVIDAMKSNIWEFVASFSNLVSSVLSALQTLVISLNPLDNHWGKVLLLFSLLQVTGDIQGM